jgi:hypothetical protein
MHTLWDENGEAARPPLGMRGPLRELRAFIRWLVTPTTFS